MGTGDDLQVYHDGSNGYVYNSGSGHLTLQGNGSNNVNIRGKNGENGIIVKSDGNVELYYDNSKKFETESLGIKVTGRVEASTDIYIPNDTGKFKVGAGYDLQMFHDGGSSIIRNINDNASLYIQASSSGTNNIRCYPNGSTQLYHNGNLKLYTDSVGVRMNDSVKLSQGSSSDFNFWHDGSHSHIQHMNTGNLYVLCQSGQINFETGSEIMAQMIPNGACKLYHDNSVRLTTTSIGVDFNGRITTDTNNTLVAHFGTTSSTGGYVRFGLAHNGGTIGYIGSPTQLTSAGDQDDLAIRAQSDIRFATGGSTLRCTIDTGGNFYPATTNASNLGAGSLRWNEAYIKKISLNTSSTNSQFTLNGASGANVMSIRNTTGGNGNVGILFSTQDHSGGREKAAIYHQERHGQAHYGGDFIFCLANSTGGAAQVGPSDERMRIQRNGTTTFGHGTEINLHATNTAGICLNGNGNSGQIIANASGNRALIIGRISSDGQLVEFTRGTSSNVGGISVSGSTVSYNGGHISRSSQLVGISTNIKSDRPTLYQGTVMSNLDEMCDWGDGRPNQQLNKTKVSDSVGDKDVAGVFWAWDDDSDTYTNDFYVAMTGDMVIRVAGSTTVARGDLLESAGDGTAKPQSDDIVRSKTVAKVTSGIAHTTYADGSKVYPCVLMAC